MSDQTIIALPESMRAVVCHGPHDYRLQEWPTPTPGPGEVLLRVASAGICASDLKCYHGAPLFWGDGGRKGYCQPPVIAGHEFVGEVVALGEGAGREVRAGRSATSPCRSRSCRAGNATTASAGTTGCARTATSTASASMPSAPWPSTCCCRANAINYRVPDTVSPEHAVYIEPLACAIHAVQRGQIEFGDVVVIAGAGPLGLGMVAAARLKSPRLIIALDRIEKRLAAARACGADLVFNIDRVDVVDRGPQTDRRLRLRSVYRGSRRPVRRRARASTWCAHWAATCNSACYASLPPWIGPSSATRRS